MVGLAASAALALGQGLTVQIREDPNLERHGIVVTTSQSPNFRESISQITGGNVESLNPILSNSMVVTNASSQPVTHVTVRYMRVALDGNLGPVNCLFDANSLSRAVPPNESLLVLPNSIQYKPVRILQKAVNSAERMFPSAMYSSAYAFIDSVEFADGTVIGPDTLGYLDDQVARAQVLAEIRDKLYDESLSDAQLVSWLRPGVHANQWVAVGGLQGESLAHLAFQTQALSRTTLSGLEHYGRERMRVMIDELLSYQKRVVRVKAN